VPPRGLPARSRATFRVVSESDRQSLDGDLTADPRVTGAIDFAHASSANQTERHAVYLAGRRL